MVKSNDKIESPTTDKRILVGEITLSTPIKDGDQTYTKIAFPRRPLGGDFFGLSPNLTVDVLLTIGLRMAGLPTHLQQKMDGSDVLAVQTLVLSFLESGLIQT